MEESVNTVNQNRAPTRDIFSTMINCFNLVLALSIFDSFNLAHLLKGKGKPPCALRKQLLL